MQRLSPSEMKTQTILLVQATVKIVISSIHQNTVRIVIIRSFCKNVETASIQAMPTTQNTSTNASTAKNASIANISSIVPTVVTVCIVKIVSDVRIVSDASTSKTNHTIS